MLISIAIVLLLLWLLLAMVLGYSKTQFRGIEIPQEAFVESVASWFFRTGIGLLFIDNLLVILSSDYNWFNILGVIVFGVLFAYMLFNMLIDAAQFTYKLLKLLRV